MSNEHKDGAAPVSREEWLGEWRQEWRYEFAGRAMQGMLAAHEEPDMETIVRWADALLAELEK